MLQKYYSKIAMMCIVKCDTKFAVMIRGSKKFYKTFFGYVFVLIFITKLIFYLKIVSAKTRLKTLKRLQWDVPWLWKTTVCMLCCVRPIVKPSSFLFSTDLFRD